MQGCKPAEQIAACGRLAFALRWRDGYALEKSRQFHRAPMCHQGVSHMGRGRRAGLIMALALGLAGCVAAPAMAPVTRDMSSADLVATAKAEYRAGHFAKAQSLAARAATDPAVTTQALLIEAAALDRLKSFDRADAVYRRLFPAIGSTAAFNNNYGYSMMLRGNLTMARKYLLLAQQANSGSPTVTNNMDMLRNAGSYQRSR
jgi:Tfp pilus assembly protein PilF